LREKGGISLAIRPGLPCEGYRERSEDEVEPEKGSHGFFVYSPLTSFLRRRTALSGFSFLAGFSGLFRVYVGAGATGGTFLGFWGTVLLQEVTDHDRNEVTEQKTDDEIRHTSFLLYSRFHFSRSSLFLVRLKDFSFISSIFWGATLLMASISSFEYRRGFDAGALTVGLGFVATCGFLLLEPVTNLSQVGHPQRTVKLDGGIHDVHELLTVMVDLVAHVDRLFTVP
jgi:hypothetical protein